MKTSKTNQNLDQLPDATDGLAKKKQEQKGFTVSYIKKNYRGLYNRIKQMGWEHIYKELGIVDDTINKNQKIK